MRWGEAVFHPLLPVCPIFLLYCLVGLFFRSEIRSEFFYITKIARFQLSMCGGLLSIWGILGSNGDLCVCVSRVVAENDFLHTLLNKVTASRGDSGGQGTHSHTLAFCFLLMLHLLQMSEYMLKVPPWTVHVAVICVQMKWPFPHNILASPLCTSEWRTLSW